jgi:hypothetical protein
VQDEPAGVLGSYRSVSQLSCRSSAISWRGPLAQSSWQLAPFHPPGILEYVVDVEFDYLARTALVGRTGRFRNYRETCAAVISEPGCLLSSSKLKVSSRPKPAVRAAPKRPEGEPSFFLIRFYEAAARDLTHPAKSGSSPKTAIG